LGQGSVGGVSARIDVLLGKIDEHLDEVVDHYNSDLESKELSDELVYAIGSVIQDCQRAFDWTATAIRDKFVTKKVRPPYFPLVKEPKEFRAKLEAQLPGLWESAPEVAKAIQRHQPYRKGKTELGYLHKLARVEKHVDFTPQTRRQSSWIQAGGVGFQFAPRSEGAGVSFGGEVAINGVPVDPNTLQPLGGGRNPYIETIYVDWRFVDPSVSVLPTLESLARLTRAAVRDVRRKASL